MPAGNCISVCFKDTIKASCGDPSLWGIVLLVYVCVCVCARVHFKWTISTHEIIFLYNLGVLLWFEPNHV